MKNGIYFEDTNKGQCPADEQEALVISEKAGYSKQEIEDYFETSSNSLTINWKGWNFKWCV